MDHIIGFCTCGNTPILPSNVSLITEHSEGDLRRILESKNFSHIPTFVKENIFKSAKSKDPILLDGSKDYKQPINELAVWLQYKWDIGSTIKVKFLDRDAYLETQIERFAKEWETYANIKFEFGTSDDAEIRISLTPDYTSWSAIGKSCLSITDQLQPTMNFGWFNAFTSHTEIRRTTLHEFGHALGCIHEHQSSESAIKWDINAIKRAYIAGAKKTEEWVNINILNSFPATSLTNSSYDPLSIMHYPVEAAYTLNKIGVGLNTELSPMDKRFIQTCYPF